MTETNIRIFTRYVEIRRRKKTEIILSSQGKGTVTELKFSIAGSFHYFVSPGVSTDIVCDGFVSVEPELSLPLESLVCQTVLSKLLGPLSSWRDKLEVAHR